MMNGDIHIYPCPWEDGKEVKRVTSGDAGTVEDGDTEEEGPSGQPMG